MFEELLSTLMSTVVDFFINTLIGGFFDFISGIFTGGDDPLVG